MDKNEFLNEVQESEHRERIYTTVLSTLQDYARSEDILFEEFSPEDIREISENFVSRAFDHTVEEEESIDKDLIERALEPDPMRTREAYGTVEGEDITLLKEERKIIVYIDGVKTEEESFDEAESADTYFDELIDVHQLKSDE